MRPDLPTGAHPGGKAAAIVAGMAAGADSIDVGPHDGVVVVVDHLAASLGFAVLEVGGAFRLDHVTGHALTDKGLSPHTAVGWFTDMLSLRALNASTCHGHTHTTTP